MSTHNFYHELKERGLTVQEIISAARTRGDDDLMILAGLRKECGLNFQEAKKELLGDSDPFDAPQDVSIGETVYWEGWDSISGNYIKSGIVKSLEGENVRVENIKLHQITAEGPIVKDYSAEPAKLIPQKFFNKSLVERLGENKNFLQELLGK